MSKSAVALGGEDPVPSYEESIACSTTGSSTWNPATLHQQLDETRLTRVRNILSTYVDPLLAVQGASGLYKTIFLLVPSNADSLQQHNNNPVSEYSSTYSHPKKPEVLGFAATDVVKLIYLKGEEHTVEFWRQTAVMKELATNLRMRLKISGHRIEEEEAAEEERRGKDSTIEASQSSRSLASQSPSSAAKEQKTGGWFRSKPKPKKAEKSISLWETTAPSEATIVNQKLGWRAAHDDPSSSQNITNSSTSRKPLCAGVVRVQVEWKEICLRVENVVGLYETQKGPGICLSVEVGAS